MSVHADEPKDPLDTTGFMRVTVTEYLNRCIQCHRCMDVCPVTKDSFSMQQLNQATKEDQPVLPMIREFAFNCTQCGKCVPVCPANIRRDYMMRFIKSKIRHRKPWGYRRYLLIKGPNPKGFRTILQKLYVSYKKNTQRDLARYMENTSVKKADVLFYPGCYIYSTTTVRQTLRLLDYLGRSYSVLGGVTTCCGAPYLLQGEFDQADHCLRRLHEKITATDPKIIITSCAECFEAVEHLKKIYDEHFEILSVTEYLLRNKNKFPSSRIRGKIAVHDSCRFTKESPQGLAVRTTALMFGDLVEQKTPQGSVCCYQWNHGCDPYNASRRSMYLADVKKCAPTLVCNCLTCYEELKKASSPVEIIDVLQLFEEALDISQTEEKNR